MSKKLPGRGSYALESSDSKGKTTISEKVSATLSLRNMANRMNDVVFELVDHIGIIDGNKDTSLRGKRKSIENIKSTIIPYLNQCSTELVSSANSLAPIASTNYVNSMQERERKQKILNEIKNTKKSKSLLMIESAVSSPINVSKLSRNSSFTKQVVPQRNLQRNLPSILSSLPPPSNGNQYSKKETMDMLINYKTGSSTRAKIINHLIAKKLMPQTRQTVYRHLKEYRKDSSNATVNWQSIGRQQILDSSDINDVVKDLNEQGGKSIGNEELIGIIREKKQKKMEDQGHVPLSVTKYTPSATTLDNYKALIIAKNSSVTTSNYAVSKSNSRYTSENSLISSMALLLVIAATHYIVIEEDNLEVRLDMKKESTPKGVIKLYNMISSYYKNLPIFPIKPQYIFSTDDTVIYTFEGLGTKEEKFRLVSVKSKNNAGKHSVYKLDNSKAMSGLRVKLTFTFSALGACAPLFVSITGLSERELPSSPCIILKIEGLCIGGGGVNVGCKDTGYIFLMRSTGGKNDESVDKQRYKYYRDNVLLPFIKKSRQEYDGCNENECGLIPRDLTAVSWCDGDLAQIGSIVNDLSLFDENRIIGNKQNNARSGVEQPADLSKSFKILKRMQQEHTVSHLSVSSHPLKRIIVEEFERLTRSGELRFATNKKKAVVDFACNLPAMCTVAITSNYVQEGFMVPGVIDYAHRRYPDYDMILSTCQKNISNTECKLCEDAFESLLDLMIKNGHMPDSTFEKYNFPMDRDCVGNHVRRPATIAQEARQRAKILTHDRQEEMRAAQLIELSAETNRKSQTQKDKLLAKANANEQCMEKIFSLMEKENCNEIKMSNATLEHFSNCSNPMLEAFVLARTEDLIKSRLPKKGKLIDAQNGERNMILLAFECKEKENMILKKHEDLCDNTSSPNDASATDVTMPFTEIDVEQRISYISDNFLPSSLFNVEDWIRNVVICFDPKEKIVNDSALVNKDEIVKQSQLLLNLLQNRLTNHLNRRLHDSPSKKNHWIIPWIRKNLSPCASLLVFFKHVKKDLSCLDNTKTLLTTSNNFILVREDNEHHQGCYLHYDKNDQNWMRSGKVTGQNKERGFKVRHEEHFKKAKADHISSNTSRFYIFYPSHESPRSQSKVKLGVFEHLQLFVGLGWDASNTNITNVLSRNINSSGIFLFDEVDKENINEINFRGNLNEKEKKIELIAYLIELVFDLCISPKNNISSSPGFEVIFGAVTSL